MRLVCREGLHVKDVYAEIASADKHVQARIADVLELRAADSQQRAMLESYTSKLSLRAEARVLEVGCGTGAVSRFLAQHPVIEEVVGVDPCDLFIERARELTDDSNVGFEVGDGRDLDFPDETFDAVVFHTTLCHVPECELALAEAQRVLLPRGQVVIFDGDYATTTVAIHANDPLQACVDAAIASLVHDPWLVRRITRLLEAAGFSGCELRGYAYTQTSDADYMVTLIERGADALAADGKLTTTTAEAMKEEAHARVETGSFFGHIAYASAIAQS
jgi:ubiquinone/menaquinone biosynthesis C-methylase UbiE